MKLKPTLIYLIKIYWFLLKLSGLSDCFHFLNFVKWYISYETYGLSQILFYLLKSFGPLVEIWIYLFCLLYTLINVDFMISMCFILIQLFLIIPPRIFILFSAPLTFLSMFIPVCILYILWNFPPEGSILSEIGGFKFVICLLIIDLIINKNVKITQSKETIIYLEEEIPRLKNENS